ncbi:MAG: hypothetical protein WBQ37_02560 [Candidatus Competibacter sp.]
MTVPDTVPSGAPTPVEYWVGIDVAKTHLDVAIWPTRKRLRVTRDEAGAEAPLPVNLDRVKQ